LEVGVDSPWAVRHIGKGRYGSEKAALAAGRKWRSELR
jgi:hypothetical protein